MTCSLSVLPFGALGLFSLLSSPPFLVVLYLFSCCFPFFPFHPLLPSLPVTEDRKGQKRNEENRRESVTKEQKRRAASLSFSFFCYLFGLLVLCSLHSQSQKIERETKENRRIGEKPSRRKKKKSCFAIFLLFVISSGFLSGVVFLATFLLLRSPPHPSPWFRLLFSFLSSSPSPLSFLHSLPFSVSGQVSHEMH